MELTKKQIKKRLKLYNETPKYHLVMSTDRFLYQFKQLTVYRFQAKVFDLISQEERTYIVGVRFVEKFIQAENPTKAFIQMQKESKQVNKELNENFSKMVKATGIGLGRLAYYMENSKDENKKR